MKLLPGKLPPLLKRGDLVRVVSPAGPADPGLIDLGIDRILGWGLRAEVAPHATERVGFLAGEDSDRVDDLAAALLDPNVSAVFCSRGGYGAVRILDSLPWEEIGAAPPKIFVGFSDIGVVQSVLWSRCGWISFSAPQVAHGLGGDISDRTERHMRQMLESGPRGELAWPDSPPLALNPIIVGEAKGVLLPICMTMLVCLVGTPFMPDLDGVILCLEDTAEPPYRIDRMFWQIAASGAADKIAGLLVGSFSFRGLDVSEDAAMSAVSHLGKLGVPIWKGMPYGHQDERLTLPLGVSATVSKSGKVRID